MIPEHNKELRFELSEAKNGLVVAKGIGIEGELNIPSRETIAVDSKFKTFPVAKIGARAFLRNDKITKVIIPDSVICIGNAAFSGCKNLSSVIFGNAVSIIEKNAFFSCSSITYIEIPTSCFQIQERAFDGCSNLKEVHYKGTIEQWKKIDIEDTEWLKNIKLIIDNKIVDFNEVKNVFQGGPWKDKYGNKYETVVDEYGVIYNANKPELLQAPKDLKEYVIPEGTQIIHVNAFCYCTELKSISIPDSVVTICANAFFCCTQLKEIHIPKFLLEIATRAFTNCKALQEITIPSSVKTIKYGAFEGCEQLRSVVIPENVERIEENAFYNCPNLHATILGLKKFIGANAFGNFFSKADVEIIVDGKKLEKGKLNSNRGRYESIVYEGDIYDGKPNGFGKRTLERMDGEETLDSGYYYNGLFVTGPGFDEQGRRHGNGYFHGLTDEEFDEIWHDAN